MVSIDFMKDVENVATDLCINFSKMREELIVCSDGKKRLFDIFKFKNGNEFFICAFNDQEIFGLGGAYNSNKLQSLMCPIHKIHNHNDWYHHIKDLCNVLLFRENAQLYLYIKQGNIGGFKNELNTLSCNELTAAFNIAAFHGQLEICKSIYEIASYMYASHAMIFACQQGKLDTAKWLYSIGGDPHYKNCKCLRHVLNRIAKDKHILLYYDVLDWLCTVTHPFSLKKYPIPYRPIYH